MFADIKIKASVIKKWYLNTGFINNLTKNDVGLTKTLNVNGIKHEVRLIGVNEDVNESDGVIHTTWEFANCICDSDGYTLATRMVDDEGSWGRGYKDSDMRNKVLNGGDSGVQWAQKYGGKWSTKYQGSVLSMLPTDLADVIKPAKKKIIYESDDGESHGRVWYEPYWKKTTIVDKLFLLSPKELGFDSPNRKGSDTYSYYEGKGTSAIVKKQINDTQYGSSTFLDNGEYGHVTNYAGYYWNGGTPYHTRINIGNNGEKHELGNDYRNTYYINIKSLEVNWRLDVMARLVAPAFCL